MEIDIAKNALIARRHIFLKTVRMSLQLRITVCALLESDYRDPTMEESAQVLLRYGNAMLAPFTDEQNNAFDCLERIAKRMLDDIEHKPNTTGVTGVEGGVDTTGVEGGEEVEVVHQTIGVKPVETYCVTRMNRVTFITPTSVVDATDMTTGVADVTDTTNDDTTEPSKE